MSRMRGRRLSVLALALLLLLLLLLSAALVASSMMDCHRFLAKREIGPSIGPVPYVGTGAPFSASQCSFTFGQFDNASLPYQVCFHQARVALFTCPRDCLSLYTVAPAAARVLGSFPYAANSSICLAAIHSGIITNAAGGGLFVDRFWPEDWSNSSTQSLFPRGSAHASFSNGVQSSAVPNATNSTAAPLSSYSWTVRSRGVLASQRQSAPFSPRAGHVHAVIPRLAQREGWPQYLHLIIGGYNTTHYLRDAWLYVADPIMTAPNPQAAVNGRWTQLPDAPFSPRAFMGHHYVESGDWDLFNQSFAASPTRVFAGGTLVLVGGQTGHACGNRDLGRCSNELWTLQLEEDARSSIGVRLQWSTTRAAVGRFSPRCGFSLIADRRLISSKQLAIIGVMGGQLSYDHDSDCSSPAVKQINSTTEAWYSSLDDLNSWHQGRDTPFSARRSMQADDSFVTDDSLTSIAAAIAEPQELVPAADFVTTVVHADKSVSLSGGIRYVAHAWDAAANVSRTTEAEVYADVWSCTLASSVSDNNAADCDWHHSAPVADVSRGPPFLATGSLPVPVAHAASVGYPVGHQVWNARFGGVTSGAAVAAWRATMAGAMADADAAFMQQPRLVPISSPSPASSVEETRLGLPLSFHLNESELLGMQAGSDIIITHSLSLGLSRVQAMYSTLHQQARNMAVSSATSTPHLYQAADCSNTTRPLFDFSLQRRDHGQSFTFDTHIVSGGAQGGQLSNDWLTYHAQGCLVSDDPSYASSLGPGTSASWESLWVASVSWWDPSGIGPETWRIRPSFLPGHKLGFRCKDGFRFEPPLVEETVELTCLADSLWYDLALGGLRRCVPTAVRCRSPFLVSGDGCVEPEPFVLDMSVLSVQSFGFGQQSQPVVRGWDVQELPVQWNNPHRSRQLYIHGRYFRPPVSITVGGRPCLDPQLSNSSRYCPDPDLSSASCPLFYSTISCSMMDGRVLRRSAVEVRSGSPQRVVSSNPKSPRLITSGSPERAPMYVAGADQLTVQSSEPSVRSVTSSDCKAANDSSASASSFPLSLELCPNDRSSSILVCFDNFDWDSQFEYPTYALVVRLDDGPRLSCSRYVLREGPQAPCDPQLPGLLCRQVSYCQPCQLTPALGAGHRLVVAYSDGSTDNSQQALSATAAATISFAPCDVGLRERRDGEDSSLLCIPCPAGTSTNSFTGSRDCAPCPPGWYSGSSGSASCTACPAGSAAAEFGQSECSACPSNSYQRFPGQSVCTGCESNQYLRQPEGSSTSLCENCPELGVSCDVNAAWDSANQTELPPTALVAWPAAYLLIEQSSGLVSSVACSELACVHGAACLAADDGLAVYQRIPATEVAVVNCCGANRRPALDAAGELNVLCAACLPGYTSVRGRCVYCPGTQWLPFLCILLSALLVVWLLHLLSVSALTSSALLSILVYFWQMSALLTLSEALPVLLSFLNVDLLGESGSAGGLVASFCIVPLSAYGKLTVRLLSPLVAVALLCLLLIVQLAAPLWKLRTTLTAADSAGVRRWMLRQLSMARLHIARRDDRGLAAATDGPLLEPEPAGEASYGQSECPSPAAAGAGAADGSLSSILVPYRHTLLRLALFSYNSLTATCLGYFHSQRVGQFGYRLWAYPDVDTDDPRYRLFRPFILLCLVLVAAVGPAALAYYLYRLRQRGEQSMDSAGVVLMAMYEERYWWYSVYILARRLLLIVLFTFLPPASAFFALSGVNMAVLCVQLDCRPYRRQADNQYETLTLAALTAQTLLMAALPAAETRPAWAAAALWLNTPLVVGGIVAHRLSVAALAVWKSRREAVSQRALDQQEDEEELY